MMNSKKERTDVNYYNEYVLDNSFLFFLKFVYNIIDIFSNMVMFNYSYFCFSLAI